MPEITQLAVDSNDINLDPIPTFVPEISDSQPSEPAPEIA